METLRAHWVVALIIALLWWATCSARVDWGRCEWQVEATVAAVTVAEVRVARVTVVEV